MTTLQRKRRSMVRGKLPLLETLEQRALLSVAVADASRANAKPTPTAGPEIELAWVALHEFGHALGLAHNNAPGSIMYPYYNPGYNFDAFESDPAVQQFRSMFSADNVAAELTPWKDALDGDDDGHVEITYSWVRDGARMDSGGTSNTDKIFDANERSLIIMALNKWAEVSEGAVSFISFNGSADAKEAAIYNFAVNGLAQNDSRFGDIRIATHKFDGAGKTLAHTYYPPPNGGTAAGDAHFDAAENWKSTNLFGLISPAAAPSSGFASANTSTVKYVYTHRVRHFHRFGSAPAASRPEITSTRYVWTEAREARHTLESAVLPIG